MKRFLLASLRLNEIVSLSIQILASPRLNEVVEVFPSSFTSPRRNRWDASLSRAPLAMTSRVCPPYSPFSRPLSESRPIRNIPRTDQSKHTNTDLLLFLRFRVCRDLGRHGNPSAAFGTGIYPYCGPRIAVNLEQRNNLYLIYREIASPFSRTLQENPPSHNFKRGSCFFSAVQCQFRYGGCTPQDFLFNKSRPLSWLTLCDRGDYATTAEKQERSKLGGTYIRWFEVHRRSVRSTFSARLRNNIVRNVCVNEVTALNLLSTKWISKSHYSVLPDEISYFNER